MSAESLDMSNRLSVKGVDLNTVNPVNHDLNFIESFFAVTVHDRRIKNIVDIPVFVFEIRGLFELHQSG